MNFENPKDIIEELEMPRLRFQSAWELLKDLETIKFKGSIPGLFSRLYQLYAEFNSRKYQKKRWKLVDSARTEEDAVPFQEKDILAKNTTVCWVTNNYNHSFLVKLCCLQLINICLTFAPGNRESNKNQSFMN